MSGPFKIHSNFQPAGDQPAAIASLVEGLEDGLHAQTLLGVTGSGKTFTIANVIETTESDVGPIDLLCSNAGIGMCPDLS